VLIPQGLWGLLVAHHCQFARPWTESDITAMQQGAAALAIAPSIRNRREGKEEVYPQNR
jgi:GAF domain-containing protein